MSSASSRFRASPDTVSTRAGDEIVLVDLKTDRIYSLNRTAARVWELFSTDCDREEVRRRLLEEFDVGPSEVESAIDELVQSLVSNGLLLPRT
jgi:hypothetical protein